MEWQAVEGLIGGSLLEERPDARPNALVEVLQECLTVLSSRLFGPT